MNPKLTAIFADLAAACITLEKRYPNDIDFAREMRKKVHEVINNKSKENELDRVQTSSK